MGDWELLERWLVIDRLHRLNADTAWLGQGNLLDEGLATKNVKLIIHALRMIEVAESPMMSERERKVLLRLAKSEATTLRKIIQEILD